MWFVLSGGPPLPPLVPEEPITIVQPEPIRICLLPVIGQIDCGFFPFILPLLLSIIVAEIFVLVYVVKWYKPKSKHS